MPENQKDVLCDDPAAVPEYLFGRKGNAMTDKRAGPSVRIQRNAQARRRQILAAASSLIQEKGYGATSLDAVVERAGCSKSAIYEFFGGKEGLISALSDDIVEELSLALSGFADAPPDLDRVLQSYAEHAMTLILDEKHIAIVRVVVSEVWRFPKLGEAYFERGPAAVQTHFAEFLTRQTALGNIAIADPARASRHFWGLMLWDDLHARLVGAREAPDPGEIQIHARRVVTTFLQLYGTQGQ